MSREQIIPPLSVVRLVRADEHTPQWKKQVGRTFRVGYYSRQDGTNCVWLVNSAGQYEQTIDQAALGAYFNVEERSKERALFGRNRPPIPALPHTSAATPRRTKRSPSRAPEKTLR